MEAAQQPTIPRWAWKLLARIGRLEAGRAYRLTLVMPASAEAEPTWLVEDAGRMENAR